MKGYRIPQPANESVCGYVPGSPEREKLKAALNELKSKQIEIPLVIDGKEIRTDKRVKITAPHDHNLILGYAYHGGKKEFQMAIDAALKAQKSWAALPAEQRV
ncbi:1-pyrroline-5-carboxylate dehydrogenase, partial [bacterium]|nr:1-pyrroline-5-carboxylate dehydrogenase [bacterium]